MKTKIGTFGQITLLGILIVSTFCQTAFAGVSSSVTTDKELYDTGETIKVSYSNAPGNDGDWICIASSALPDTDGGTDYQYLPKGSEKGTLTFDLPTPGKYEVRAYYNYNRNGYKVAARYPFTVKGIDIKQALKKYREINIGWVDLGEEKYKDFGYDDNNKNDWNLLIDGLNLEKFPSYLKEYIPKKSINTAKSASEKPTPKGLVITFSDVVYIQQTSSAARFWFGKMAGSDVLKVTVHFIDGESGKELYSKQETVSSESFNGWASMNLDGRLNNSFYNLAHNLAELTN